MYELLNAKRLNHFTLDAENYEEAVEEARQKATSGEWYIVNNTNMRICLHFYV